MVLAQSLFDIGRAEIGMAVVFLGMMFHAWVWRVARNSRERHCRKCGYNLKGLTSACCPRCDLAIPKRADPIAQSRRNDILFGLGVVCEIVGGAMIGYGFF